MSRRKSTAPGDCPRAVLDLAARFHQHHEAYRQQTYNEAQVRREFIKEIERWRDLLARNIALRNPGLSVRDLNYAVSKTIDRLIFLRMCEDRGVETYAQLRVLLNGPRVYDRLRTLFRSADDRYKSGLFYLQREKDRPDAPDELTPALSIDDGVLKDIIKGLYYPDCPYEFSVLPAEILGQVYEQFLGKVIRLTKGHRAVVEEKPEVKKAGGVYYTPTYIVDYIVQHTVGKLLEGRTVKWIARDKRKKLNRPRLDRSLRVLDPACGSGSFLLGAYQYLLRWYLDYYTANDPDQWTRRPNPPIHESGGGPSSWRLSIAERKRILLEHIFGVDIDAQAVEVTKLSLLLKVLEGESQQTLDSQLRLFHERALPDLAANIKCGNSLIGPDFYDDRQMSMFDEEERYRINVFDWQAEFPDVFEQNRARKGAAKRNPERKRPARHAAAPDGAEPVAHARGSDQALDSGAGFDAVIGNPPYLSFSGRQAVELPDKERSYCAAHYRGVGWITAHGLFIERSVRDLSRRLTGFIVPDQVGHLDGYESVREAVSHYTKLAEVRYWGEAVFEGVVTPALTFVADRSHRGKTLIRRSVDSPACRARCEGGKAWTASAIRDLLPKLGRRAQSLGKLVADPGVHTGNCSKKLIQSAGGAEPDCVPVLEGKQVSRYRCDRPARVLKLDYSAKQGEYFAIRPRHKYTDAPFVIRQTAAQPIVGPREHADYFRNSLLALYPPKDGTDVRYLVGLLNSRLIRYVYCQTVHESRQKAFPQVKVRSLRALPIRRIAPAEPSDRAQHDRMVHLVDRMLELHQRLAQARTPADKTAIERQIEATDLQIDRLVYGLYGLTDEEIAIVEEATT